jgi:hypothetical protein
MHSHLIVVNDLCDTEKDNCCVLNVLQFDCCVNDNTCHENRLLATFNIIKVQ